MLRCGRDALARSFRHLRLQHIDRRLLRVQAKDLRRLRHADGVPLAEAEVDAHAAAVAELDSRLDALTSEMDAARSELDGELAALERDRAVAAGAVPDEVLVAYESTRSRLGGVGAARLLGNRCEGCHLEIPSAELEALRHAPEDALVLCPECDRILVR